MKPIFMKWMETITPWNISVALIFCSTLTLQDEYTVSKGDGFVPEAEAILITTPLCLATIIGKTILVIWKRYNFTAKKKLYMFFVFLCIQWCPLHIVLWFCFVCLHLVYPSLCCQFLWIVHFLLPLWYSLTFIETHWQEWSLSSF